ncbi:MAG: hypothetical protein MJ182_01595 [Treponema sp.]|nr:hypothetical protein [Treponema sp.]
MTIKTRNGLSFSLFLFSLVVLVVNVLFFVYSMIVNPCRFYFDPNRPVYSILFEYQPIAVFISLFFMNLYVVITSKAMTDAFAKTQCSEISFFYCFLVSCLFESARFYIPLLSVDNTFSESLILLGDLSIFARILAPLSLLFAVIMNGPEQRQYTERNMLVIIVASMFLAMALPLNTSVLEKDFRVHAGFDTIIVVFEILVHSLAVISLFIYNIREKYSQKTSLGLAMIIAGFVMSINSVNFFILVLSILFFCLGTVFYLKELHDRNLYS